MGNLQLLLSPRPISYRSSVSNKTPKFGNLSVKIELFPSKKQNCLKAPTQSSLGLHDNSSNTEKPCMDIKTFTWIMDKWICATQCWPEVVQKASGTFTTRSGNATIRRLAVSPLDDM